MTNFDLGKVLSAWGANTGLFAVLKPWVSDADVIAKVGLSYIQWGVGLVTIVYIGVKIYVLVKSQKSEDGD